MVISRTKQLARKVKSPPDKKAHEAKMKDGIAARHGIKRPAVGGVTKRARIKARKWGSQGKTTAKANTESDVSGDDDSDTETVYSDDVSVLRSKMSIFSSSLDIDGDNDTSLYGKDISTPKLSDHEMPQHANVVGEDVENVSTSLNLRCLLRPQSRQITKRR
jgi:hypothetical protein